MATINVRYVDPDAAVGGDGTTNALSGANCAYVSLSAWEAARQGDLVTADVVERAVCCSNGDNHTADTATLVISGSTTSASCYHDITVESGSRHTGKWNDTKYRHSCNDRVTVSDSYVRIDGLQFAVTGNGIYFNSGDYPIIKNCIVKPFTGTPPYGIRFNCAGLNRADVINTIVYGGFSRGIAGYYDGSGRVIYCYQCTVSGCGISGLSARQPNSMRAYNCVVFNNADDFEGTWSGGYIDHCASDDGDGTNAVDISPGATEADDWAAAFTDYANGDFSIKDANSVLYDAGTDLSSYMEAVDIIGTERPQGSAWDIGAFEYVDEGGTLSIPVAMHHYNLLRSA